MRARKVKKKKKKKRRKKGQKKKSEKKFGKSERLEERKRTAEDDRGPTFRQPTQAKTNCLVTYFRGLEGWMYEGKSQGYEQQNQLKNRARAIKPLYRVTREHENRYSHAGFVWAGEKKGTGLELLLGCTLTVRRLGLGEVDGGPKGVGKRGGRRKWVRVKLAGLRG